MITNQLMETLFPTKNLNPRKYNLVRERRKLIDALNETLPRYEINTYRRVCAFLATCGIETDYFKTSEEYASGTDYEGRRDLGNIYKGDGKKFKGRGIIQTTGRYNYSRLDSRLSAKFAFDPLKNPERLNEVKIAVESACIFWQEHNLNKYADAKLFKQLNGIVNRGNKDKMPLHWEKRNLLYSKCIRKIPQDFVFEVEAENAVTVAVVPEPVIPADPLKDVDLDKVSEHYSSITATLQQPSIKTVLSKLVIRLSSGLAFVWSTTSGKIALILSAMVLAAVICGVGYSYRNQIRLGAQRIKSYIKGKFITNA